VFHLWNLINVQFTRGPGTESDGNRKNFISNEKKFV